MIPKETGYYWLKLTDTSAWQVVYVIRGRHGGDILFTGLSERVTNATFYRDYPSTLWSDRLSTPIHVRTE